MANRDKIRELAEKQANRLMWSSFSTPPTDREIANELAKILRAELKPFLDAATKALARGNWDALAAKLQDWRKE